jgi:DNA invertase Pin-like site-specific DNA recombinase|tara:strand:+ start:103 stop:303 length:201 start_codon:yes stop_codon:yes gene_type:complete
MSINIYERKDRRGGGYSKRKFTFEVAQQIRIDYESGIFTQEQIAIKYGVSQSLINKILRFKTYTKK